jgi:hypothetical protein
MKGMQNERTHEKCVHNIQTLRKIQTYRGWAEVVQRAHFFINLLAPEFYI